MVEGLAQQIFEAYPAPTVIVDDGLRLLMVNRAARVMLGHEHDAGLLSGVPYGEALRCVDFEVAGGCGRKEACSTCAILGSVKGALTTGAVHRARTFRQLRLPGGMVEVCLLVSAAPIEAGGGSRVILTLEEVSDIQLKDDLLRTEGALRDALRRAAALARFPEENPNPVLRLGADHIVVYANQAARSELGLPDVGGRAPELLAAPARRAAEGGRRVSTEASLGERVFALSFCPVGTDVNVYGHDVTERKRAADLLSAEKERLSVTLRCIGDGVIATDQAGRVTLLNGVAEELTGWKAEEAAGRPIQEIFRIVSEETRQPTANPVFRALREGTTVGLANHTALLSRDGSERPIADSAAPIRDCRGQVAGVVLVFRDRTEERRAEQALRDADRNKDEFLAVLSHELRNPLAPIRNGLYLLDRVPPESAQAKQAKAILKRQTDHLARLVDDLLDVTRISRGKVVLDRSVVDAREVVEHTCQDHQSLFEELGLALRVEISADPVPIHADATRLAQVVGNLLQNAAKFTLRGGTTVVTVAALEGQAEIRVRDDGVGIDAGLLGRVFEPFAQGESPARAKSGLGLGLSLVKGLVELHGGAVEARSEGASRGSEFIVRLPLAAGPAAARPEGTDGPVRGSCSVLVIEDYPDSRTTLADVLTLHGFRVHVAEDGSSGIAMAQEFVPDVVLCDIGLPDMSGCEVARVLRASPALRSTVLVALSGYAQERDRERVMEAGFDVHVPKPAALEDLLAVLSKSGLRQ